MVWLITRADHYMSCGCDRDDCRLWMRLHFWALRESPVWDASPSFCEYTKFIGHFVSVYERSATQFARESLRWSADPRNLEAYRAGGNVMGDAERVVGVPLRAAVAQLPPAEQDGASDWPYV